ncbi:MAG: PEP/pyruvate-binding domain-containing protein [Ruminiclostridium sp.]
MAAFEKIKSGLNGLDIALHNIRLGDNVVWQLSNIDEYVFFVKPFVVQAIADNRNIIYIRFAEHPPIIPNQPGLKTIYLDPNIGFESFTVKVHEIISDEGIDSFYVFDCLSELQVEWGTDLMMGNFFTVTCPYLFELDTVAYFGILRNRHSFEAIARIRDTTQLLIDVYGSGDEMYVHPLKVWNRYSQSMFLAHKFNEENCEELEPLTDGISASKFYSLIAGNGTVQTYQSLDNWDKFFIRAGMELESGLPQNSETIEKLCRMLIGREKHLTDLVKSQFQVKDFLQIKERMIGSGSIGGKAIGMILARKIISNNKKELFSFLEPHDSFYIGSDVFYTYLVQNGWWKLRLTQRSDEGYFSVGKELNQKLLGGTFQEGIKEQFIRMLEYFGQNPIIVRSSSLLEDSFGNAFAGKYESVFCVNTGSMEQRLKEFEKAVKLVYASSMDESALTYRTQRGLDKNDEQMAILVQRVSGSIYEDIFMPCAAGVGFSYNSYVWNKQIDPSEGLIRLVLGLGTRAVDRTDGDYPRLAALDKPSLSPVASRIEKAIFSQRNIDVLDLKNNSLSTININLLNEKVPSWFKEQMFENDREAENSLRNRGINKEVLFTTCEGVLKNDKLVNCLKEILNTIEKYYEYPVDIEFTINFSKSGAFVINLLQCRPLQVRGLGKMVEIPPINQEETLFSIGEGCSMGGSIFQPIDIVIIVDPKEYYHANISTKHNVARVIGKLNAENKVSKKTVMLLGPGRWGTSSPELGVPISFAEISGITALCEVSYEGAGYMPELSFGSHFFQDLVEEEIFYCAIFENSPEVLYSPEILSDCETIYNDIIETQPDTKAIITAYDTSKIKLTLLADAISQRTVCVKMNRLD